MAARYELLGDNNEIRGFRGDFHFLSNFYPCKFEYEGVNYQNAEAAFQAQKCANFMDKFQFGALSASDAKRKGRRVALRSDWESVKIDIMRKVVKAKFDQNPDLLSKLLDTGSAYLEETNDWKDDFWGVASGAGQNHLGKILMEHRDSLLPLLRPKTTH